MKETDNINLVRVCEYCGEETDTRYLMSREGESWVERNGEVAMFGDLFCCYDCCTLLEEQSELEASRRRQEKLQRREEWADESDRELDQ